MAKNKKTFDDVKMTIATISITMTIVFWNLFAASANNTETVSAAKIPQITATVEPIVQVVEPTPTFVGKILLGGEAPQPRVIVVQQSGGNNNGGGNNGGNNGGGGGNAGGGGGGTTATTQAS